MGFEKTLKQKELFEHYKSETMHIMAYGGSRSAKTFGAVLAIVLRMFLCPGSRHIAFRLHFNAIKTSLWHETLPKVLELRFPQYNNPRYFNKTDYYFRPPNGSEFWVAGLDEGERTDKVLGKEYSTLFFNEASEIDHGSIEVAMSRLAQKNSLQKKAYYDMNPPSKRHWSYKKFIEHINPDDGTQLDPEDFKAILMNPGDNMENLDPSYLKTLNSLSIAKKKRFLLGAFNDDDENNLFKFSYIQRIYEGLDYDRIIVAIDPAVTANENSDETGITVVAKKGDFGYLLADVSGKYKPSEWGHAAVEVFKKFGCDMIIAETNNGGDLVESVIRNIDRNIPYKSVRATRGKVKRAEPIASLYETSRIFHYGVFEKLENQMIEFKTTEEKNLKSPDRMDALVWGFTELFQFELGIFQATIL